MVVAFILGVIMNTITELMEREISLFREAKIIHNHESCFRHLSRAHILSQSSTFNHLRIHWLMFGYAIGRKDYGEVMGQILRLLVTVPGHLLGRVPVGNIGWSTVGLVEELPIPEDLRKVIEEAKSA